MTTPAATRPGWAEPIPVRSITGRRAEVSATATTVQGDPNGPDGPRWLLRATTYGPNGGHRGDVEMILDPDTRDTLLTHLFAQPGRGPAAPIAVAAQDLAAFRQLAAELDGVLARLDDGDNGQDVPDVVHDRRDQIDRELAGLALALLGGAR